jgi:hypothetical protein
MKMKSRCETARLLYSFHLRKCFTVVAIVKRNQWRNGAAREQHDFAQLQRVELQRLKANAHFVESLLRDLSACSLDLVGAHQRFATKNLKMSVRKSSFSTAADLKILLLENIHENAGKEKQNKKGAF